MKSMTNQPRSRKCCQNHLQKPHSLFLELPNKEALSDLFEDKTYRIQFELADVVNKLVVTYTDMFN